MCTQTRHVRCPDLRSFPFKWQWILGVHTFDSNPKPTPLVISTYFKINTLAATSFTTSTSDRIECWLTKYFCNQILLAFLHNKYVHRLRWNPILRNNEVCTPPQHLIESWYDLGQQAHTFRRNYRLFWSERNFQFKKRSNLEYHSI